jgi:23S rRNA pseudouridine1911/1915/1917 synthase
MARPARARNTHHATRINPSVPKPAHIELADGTLLPILYEDRSVIAIDKPPGWMLVPHSWQKTNRNLQAAIVSSIAAGHYWARSRGLKFLRHIHRLDAETSGVLLFARSLGAVETYGRLFESRRMEKRYLAVVHGTPRQTEWTCREPIGPDAGHIGRMRVDIREGKEAETHFKLLQAGAKTALLEARPITGRTHQIRVHLLAGGCPVVGDELYGPPSRSPAGGNRSTSSFRLGLRSVRLAYIDSFTRSRVTIEAPTDAYLREFGFAPDALR